MSKNTEPQQRVQYTASWSISTPLLFFSENPCNLGAEAFCFQIRTGSIWCGRMRKKKQNKRLAPSPAPERTAKFLALLRAVLALGLLAVGLYYEWGSALCTVCLTALLLWYAQGGALRLRRGLPLVAVLTVTGFYLLSAL